MSAASNARKGRPDLEIVVFEAGEWVSYSACGIPYLVGGDVKEVDDLLVRTPRELRDRLHIDVRTQHRVTAVDVHERSVEVHADRKDRTFTLGFDELVIATGAKPFRPELPGIDAPWVRGVQTLVDANELLRHASDVSCREVVVVGGGYIGLEMAEAFVRWGATVTVLEAADHVMGSLDADFAERIHASLRGIGVDVRTNTGVLGFESRKGESNDRGSVTTEDGAIPADVVVLGMGVAPSSELADAAGLALGVKGAIVVDRQQRTSVDGVWAAGDCALSQHRVSGQPVHIALGTVANKQGRVAGINIAGGYATFPGVVGTAITKVCNTEVARTGLTEGEAAAAGFSAIATTTETSIRAGYLPDAGSMAVKLVAERGTGLLLGAQIVGDEGSAKRIDTIATALWSRLTVGDLIDLDLAYAPPFSSVWDPVQTAARKAERALAAVE